MTPSNGKETVRKRQGNGEGRRPYLTILLRLNAREGVPSQYKNVF